MPLVQSKPITPVLPSDLVLTPASRWPTRLPEETVQAALALPIPNAISSDRMPGRRASIVIVTHNGLPYTKLCLTSLLGHGWKAGDELIVVDNASSDGTPEYLAELKRLHRFVRVICNAQNRGFAAANNQGLVLATGDVLILLNNDTIVPGGWRDALVRSLGNRGIGMVGPVTNRTCNEAQIDAPYRTCAELEQFAQERLNNYRGQTIDLPMLAMFCAAMRWEVFDQIGSLDEQFEIGMFEDDDYARRLRLAGYRLVCAEDAFVHHFGQGSMGELCTTGTYDSILEANRRRFEQKWSVEWQPHGRRITPEYEQLRERIRAVVSERLPANATVVVVSKGDDELLRLSGRRGWHFPQAVNGGYANFYPANSAEAIQQLNTVRAKGGSHLLVPKPGFWWLEHYGEFKEHLERHYRLAVGDETTCLIFDLQDSHD